MKVTARYKAAGRPIDYQMRVLFQVPNRAAQHADSQGQHLNESLDSRLDLADIPGARVIVNLFDGGPNCRVSVAFGDRAPISMIRRRMPDPHTEALFERHADTLKSWVEAVPSSHVFVADLPADLQAGTTSVFVAAVDEFGRTHHAHRVLEIQESP